MQVFENGPQSESIVGVPNRAVGAIIGKGGEVINQIKALVGVRIKVSARDDFIEGTKDRAVTISGALTSKLTKSSKSSKLQISLGNYMCKTCNLANDHILLKLALSTVERYPPLRLLFRHLRRAEVSTMVLLHYARGLNVEVLCLLTPLSKQMPSALLSMCRL